MSDVKEREQEKSIHTKKLCVRVVPNSGEKVFSVIPNFKISSLLTDIDNGGAGNGVISRPSQFFTPRTIWRPENEQKYLELFKKLEKEEKIFCIGKINRKLEVEISDEGFTHLQAMIKKYSW